MNQNHNIQFEVIPDPPNPFSFKSCLKAWALTIITLILARIAFKIFRIALVAVFAYVSDWPLIGDAVFSLFLKFTEIDGTDVIAWSNVTSFIAGSVVFSSVIKLVAGITTKFPSTQTMIVDFMIATLVDGILLFISRNYGEENLFLSIGCFTEFLVLVGWFLLIFFLRKKQK